MPVFVSVEKAIEGAPAVPFGTRIWPLPICRALAGVVVPIPTFPPLKKVFPELELIELPFDHPIYHQKFDFPKGLPKIHEHDGKPAQGFGLIYEGRLVAFYSFECDLGNGWEDQRIHNDPAERREQALKMGANIISYCFTHSL